MQVPRPQNRPVTPNSAPNVKIGGGSVSGENFGSKYWQDIQRAAKGGQDLGEAMIQHEQNRQMKEDKSAAIDANNQGRQLVADQYQSVLDQNRGINAAGAPGAVEKMLQKVYDDVSKTLKNDHQKEAFKNSWTAYTGGVMSRTYHYRDAETENYRISTLNSQIALATADAAEGILNPDDRSAYAQSWNVVNNDINELTPGMSPEAAEVFRRATLEKFHTTVIDSLATKSPKDVLDYLDSKLAKEELPAAKVTELREQYKKANIEADQKQIINNGTSEMIRMVRAGEDPSALYAKLVDMVGVEAASKAATGYKTYAQLSKDFAADAEKQDKEKEAEQEQDVVRRARQDAKSEMSATDFRDTAYRDFDLKQAKIYLETIEAEQKAVKADNSTAKVEQDMQLDRELKDAGYNAINMPSYAGLSTEDQNKWMELGKKHRELAGKPQPVKIRRYNELQQMSDDDLLDVWSNPGELDAIIGDMGGVSSKWFGNLQSRIDEYAKEQRTQGSKERKSKAESFRFLDTELNTIEREARQSLRNTGRSLSKDEQAQYLEDVLQFTDHRYEEEMRRHEVEKPEELPPEVRRLIHAEAILTYEAKGWGTATISRAEAWRQGIDISDHTIIPTSLPSNYRANYVGGEIKGSLTNGKTMYLATNIPTSVLPDNVQTELVKSRGYAIRDLATGYYMVVGNDAVNFYLPDGQHMAKNEKKEYSAVIELAGQDDAERALAGSKEMRQMMGNARAGIDALQTVVERGW